MDARFTNMETRFANLETNMTNRFNSLEARFDTLTGKVIEIDNRLTRVEATLERPDSLQPRSIRSTSSAGYIALSPGQASASRIKSSSSFFRLLNQRFGSPYAHSFPCVASSRHATLTATPRTTASTARAGND